jgi:type I restriction enzyme S subunit
LRKIKISFPVDKKEQEQLIEVIEDIFESIEKFKATLNSRLNCLKEFKKSVLQKAFSGELTAEEEMAA